LSYDFQKDALDISALTISKFILFLPISLSNPNLSESLLFILLELGTSDVGMLHGYLSRLHIDDLSPLLLPPPLGICYALILMCSPT